MLIRPSLAQIVCRHDKALLRNLRRRMVSTTDSRIRERFLTKLSGDAEDRRAFLRETARLAHLHDRKTTLGEMRDRFDGPSQPLRERSTEAIS